MHQPWQRDLCDDDCTCGRPKRKRCAPGCTCGRHRAQATPEQKAATRQRRNEWNKAYAAERRASGDPVLRARERAQYKKHGRKYHLKSTMGITLERWHEMLIEQSGRCYLCSEPLSADVTIDHDHQCCARRGSCGRCIRGFACRQCNQGLGQFKDDPERMRRAADALEAANARVRMRQ